MEPHGNGVTMPANVLSIRTITDRLTSKEYDDFWGYLGDEVTSKEAATGIVGPRTVKFVLEQIGLGHIIDREAKGIELPKGAKFQLER